MNNRKQGVRIQRPLAYCCCLFMTALLVLLVIVIIHNQPAPPAVIEVAQIHRNSAATAKVPLPAKAHRLGVKHDSELRFKPKKAAATKDLHLAEEEPVSRKRNANATARQFLHNAGSKKHYNATINIK